MNYYPNGATVQVRAIYRTRNADGSVGALINPSTVTISYQNPNGAITEKTYPDTIVRPSTGVYYLNFTAGIPGTWRWRTDGDGSTEEGVFEVNPSEFA